MKPIILNREDEAKVANLLGMGEDTRPLAVIFDRVGTRAACHNGPNKNIPRGSKEDKSSWAAFNAALPFDALVPEVAGLLRAIKPGVVRIMVSGRMEGDHPGDRRRRFAMQDWINKYDLELGPGKQHERSCHLYVHEDVYEMQTRKALGRLLQGVESQGRIEECMQALYQPNQLEELAVGQDCSTSKGASGTRPRTDEEIQTGSTQFETQEEIQHHLGRIRGDVGSAERIMSDLQATGEVGARSSISGSQPRNERSERTSLLRLQHQSGEIGTILECGCRIPSVNIGNYLFMRCGGDTRKDSAVKEEILLRDILPFYRPVVAVDDRQEVIEVWRRYGIYTIQVVNPKTLPPIAFQTPGA